MYVQAKGGRFTIGVLCSLAGIGLISSGVLAIFAGKERLSDAGFFTALGGGVAVCVGGLLLRTGRRLRIRVGSRELGAWPSEFVLYLRPFRSDPVAARAESSRWRHLLVPTADPFGHSTQEEQVATVFEQVAPMVSIDEPGKLLPRLGATGASLGADWKSAVAELIGRAKAIVVRASEFEGAGEGLQYELLTAFERAPERVLLLLPDSAKRYEAFRQAAQPFVPHRLPATVPVSTDESVGGVLWFDRDGTAHATPLKYPFSHAARSDEPLVRALHQAALPFLTRSGARSAPRRAPWGKRLAAALIDAAIVSNPLLLEVVGVLPRNSGVFVMIPAGIFYWGTAEALFAATVGKKICGLRVLDEIGVNISPKQSFLRAFGRFFEILLLPLTVVVFLIWRRPLHDIMARTIVACAR